jgi:hypothetical protein
VLARAGNSVAVWYWNPGNRMVERGDEALCLPAAAARPLIADTNVIGWCTCYGPFSD